MPKVAVVEPAPHTAMTRLVEDYLVSRRAAGLSAKTIVIYGSVLNTVLLPFCADQGLTEPSQLTQRHLDRLSAQLVEQGSARGPISRHSAHTYLRTVNYFLNWARGEGEVQAVKAKTPKLPKRLVEVLERSEIKQLEDAAPTERDKLLIRLLADTGMRAGELLGLRTGDLVERGRDRFVRVIGKGDKERLVPIPGLYARLRRYVERGRPKDAISDRIFLTLRRRPGSTNFEGLKLTGLEQTIRVLGRDVLDKRVHPHLFRHSFITWCLRRNMNPMQIQRIVGHEDLSMISKVYSQLNVDDAHDAMVAMLRAED